MSEIKRQTITPNELIREVEMAIRQRQENKYAFQVGIKDLGFEIDEDKAKALGVTLPCQSIDQAEWALRQKVINLTTLVEDDDTRHQVTVFEPQPISFSGFANCVTHSLALTDQGLFEVGRYPAMNLISQNRYWQWFLHQRLATSKQAATWQEERHLSPQQLVERIYEAMAGRSR
jgi:hypothetical protein